jgi:dCMP deaminase
MSTINKWDKRFMELTETVANWSSCYQENRHVGAIIVKDKRVMTTGYNGAPAGIKSCEEKGECLRRKLEIPSGMKHELCFAVHAEQNAIIQAGQDRCMGSSMYIWGHNFICILCKRFIVQSGIETIYLRKDENSPIEVVTAQQLREELTNDALIALK